MVAFTVIWKNSGIKLKIQQSITIDLSDSELRKAQSAATVAQALESVATMRMQQGMTQAQINEVNQRISNLQKDGTLKDLDIELKKNGIQPTDNIFLRIIGRLLGKIGLGVEDLGSSLENSIK